MAVCKTFVKTLELFKMKLDITTSNGRKKVPINFEIKSLNVVHTISDRITKPSSPISVP